MRKIFPILAGILAMCTLFSACGGAEPRETEPLETEPLETEPTLDYSDFVFEGTDEEGTVAHSTVIALPSFLPLLDVAARRSAGTYSPTFPSYDTA